MSAELSADGLVFLELSYNGGAKEAINIAKISRIRQMDEKWCEAQERPYPTVRVSIEGMKEDITIGGYSLKEMQDDINQAIKDHYQRILESELLS